MNLYTLETAIILPVIIIFIITAISVTLKFTEASTKHAEALKASASEETISNIDILRGGMILNDLYKERLS